MYSVSNIKLYRKLILFISLFLIGIGLSLIIGWFNHSFYALDAFFHAFQNSEQQTEKKTEDIAKLESQVQDTSGKIQSLIGIRGNVTLVSFWASWCGLCRVELPSLSVLYEELKDQGLQIVAINVDDESVNREDLDRLWQSMNLPFSFFFDFERQASQAFNVQSLPAHFVFSSDGKIAMAAYGANDWSHPKNISMIQDLLNNSDVF